MSGASRGAAQNGIRQNQAIGSHNQHVGRKGRQLFLSLAALEALRLKDRKAQFLSQTFNRRGSEFVAASGRTIRLGIDCKNLAARPLRERAQNHGRKIPACP